MHAYFRIRDNTDPLLHGRCTEARIGIWSAGNSRAGLQVPQQPPRLHRKEQFSAFLTYFICFALLNQSARIDFRCPAMAAPVQIFLEMFYCSEDAPF